MSSNCDDRRFETTDQSGLISSELSDPYSISTGVPKFYDFYQEQRIVKMKDILE